MEALTMALAKSAIGKVGEMLVQQIANEASLVCNFSEDFKSLKEKGEQISGFLQDVDAQSTNKQSAKQWILKVRDIAFRIEDFLEEYQVESHYSDINSVSCLCNPRELVFHYKMGRRIRDIKGQMSSLVADAQQMNLLHAAASLQQQPASTSASETQKWKKRSVMERDSQPVAIDEKVEDILRLLADASVSVIAVVGMGGVGKTFLLQNVYSKAKSMFQESIWLSISQSYSIPQLQIDLASHIGLKNEVNGVSEVRAPDLIDECLRGRKSLIVLDDVWRASQEDDLIAKLGLPVENNSECKVIVTTRSREVCNFMNAHLYQMECMSEEDSWRLFRAYAFRNTRQNTPPADLEQIAREVARECARLPLAVKIVASSMAQTTDLRGWKEKLRHLNEVMVGNLGDPIMQILKLSYDILPASLKPCFAYFSFFPEDEFINCEYLVHLWMAEGFIPHADVGWGYLRKFLNLCLVEAEEANWMNDYSLDRCKLHDLILDLAVSISKENRCVFRIKKVRQKDCLRVLLGKQGLHDDAIAGRNFSCPQFVRTLSLFKNSNIKNIPANFFSQLRVLRVLDLSQTALSSLPESVGNLKLLTVLNLSDTKIKQVPECIAKLKSVRFLDVSGCSDLVEVPPWIGKLTCLELLNIEECSEELTNHLPEGISKLFSLQTLRSDRLELAIEENGLLKLKDLANLSELRELHIKVKHQVEMRMLEVGILVRMEHMRILEIWNENGNEAEQMPFPFVETMKDLEHLVLSNFALTSRIHGFANIKILELHNYDCSDYSALSLEKMPNLTMLSLIGNNRCSELPKAFGKSGAFPKLRFLWILRFNVLEEFWEELEDEAMAGLETLRIADCPKLKNFPQGLERLKSLKDLSFSDSSTEEIRERLEEGGEERRKIIANNPHVNIEVE